MRFFYHPEAGSSSLVVEGEYYNYLFKVRRHKIGEEIAARNMQDGYLYLYKIEEVRRREATLTLVHKELKEVLPKRFFHLLWCVVDPKVVEKTLSTLNELGVGKITFIYCDRSQKNFKLRLDKLQKILINSCQQCGRSRLMELEVAQRIENVLDKDVIVIDFSDEKISCVDNIEKALIGPEGGFGERERELFQGLKMRGFDTPLVLRSETAAITIAALLLC